MSKSVAPLIIKFQAGDNLSDAELAELYVALKNLTVALLPFGNFLHMASASVRKMQYKIEDILITRGLYTTEKNSEVD